MGKDRSRKTRWVMWLHRVLRWTVGPVFVWYYRLTSENQEIADTLKPPFIIIPNHVMTFDPAIVNYYIRKPIHYVASDANFRSPLQSFLLRQMGTIATSKMADDLASLRFMMKTLKAGKVIGIFAEGQRSWDGVSMPVIPSTAKLVKMAKVPVLVSLLKGGYMTIPRWSFHGRRGRVVVEQKLAVSAEEARTLSVDQITERIESALAHDDSAYQFEKKVPYVSKKPAENLQLALFYCPNCSSLNTMYSSGKRFFCRSCGYEVEFTPYYRFRKARREGAPEPQFATIPEWSAAQTEFIESYLREAEQTGLSREIFADENAVMLTGYRLARLRPYSSGRLSFHMDGIRFEPAPPASKASRRLIGRHRASRAARLTDHFFPWEEVKALNVVYQDQLEFYHGRTLYVFKFPEHDVSASKYEICSRMLAATRSDNSAPA